MVSMGLRRWRAVRTALRRGSTVLALLGWGIVALLRGVLALRRGILTLGRGVLALLRRVLALWGRGTIRLLIALGRRS
jgi:hypothetical protein